MSEAPQPSIETLREAPVQVTWADQADVGSFGRRPRRVYGEFFTIELQGQTQEELDQYDGFPVAPASFDGRIDYEANGDKYLAAGQLNVSSEFRRNHLGERLSMALVYIAAEQGCKAIKIGFSHPAPLKIFRKIYSDDRIHFTQTDGNGEVVPLDISVDEALERISAERSRVIEHGVQTATSSGYFRYHPETDDEILPGAVDGVQAWVDVEGFDTTGLEPPIQTGILPGSEPEDDWDA